MVGAFHTTKCLISGPLIGVLSVNHWFFKRRGLALGIVTSGSSVGGVIWPIAIDHLIIKVRSLLLSLARLAHSCSEAWFWLGYSRLRLHRPWPYCCCSYDGKGSPTA